MIGIIGSIEIAENVWRESLQLFEAHSKTKMVVLDLPEHGITGSMNHRAYDARSMAMVDHGVFVIEKAAAQRAEVGLLDQGSGAIVRQS